MFDTKAAVSLGAILVHCLVIEDRVRRDEICTALHPGLPSVRQVITVPGLAITTPTLVFGFEMTIRPVHPRGAPAPLEYTLCPEDFGLFKREA